MNKSLKLLSWVFCLAGVFVFAGSVFAENKSGKITFIDSKSFTIERTSDSSTFTFLAAKDILNKLKSGQIVDVAYSKDAQGKRVASEVKIEGNAAATPAEEKKAPVKESDKEKSPANSLTKTGKITALDIVKNTFTIERAENNPKLTFTVKKELLKDLKKDLMVEVTYEKDSKGDRVASKVKILKTN